MNCRRAQSEIALWVGNDLEAACCQSLQRHLAACPSCGEYLQQMQALMQLVDDCPLRDEADAASKAAVEDSLWLSLSSRLVAVPVPRGDRFNGWVPAVAVATVCLLMVLIASPPQSTPASVPGSPIAADPAWSQSSALPDQRLPARPPRPASETLQVVELPIQSLREREPAAPPLQEAPPVLLVPEGFPLELLEEHRRRFSDAWGKDPFPSPFFSEPLPRPRLMMRDR